MPYELLPSQDKKRYIKYTLHQHLLTLVREVINASFPVKPEIAEKLKAFGAEKPVTSLWRGGAFLTKKKSSLTDLFSVDEIIYAIKSRDSEFMKIMFQGTNLKEIEKILGKKRIFDCAEDLLDLSQEVPSRAILTKFILGKVPAYLKGDNFECRIALFFCFSSDANFISDIYKVYQSIPFDVDTINKDFFCWAYNTNASFNEYFDNYQFSAFFNKLSNGKLDFFNLIKKEDVKGIVGNLVNFIVLNKNHLPKDFFLYQELGTQNSLLHTAALSQNLAVLQALLSCNIDPNLKNADGCIARELPNLTPDIKAALWKGHEVMPVEVYVDKDKEYLQNENKMLKADMAKMAEAMSLLIQVLGNKVSAPDQKETLNQCLQQLSLLQSTKAQPAHNDNDDRIVELPNNNP